MIIFERRLCYVCGWSWCLRSRKQGCMHKHHGKHERRHLA
jgi:hypothetical protein